MAHVVKTMFDTLPDDPWHALFATPPVLAALVAQGALGAKTKAGFFRKVGKDIQVLDPGGARLPRRGRRGRAGSGRDAQDPVAGREVREAARVARIRRRSSCGRSSAISSTTARITWRRSPTMRATSTSRSAGASAGRWGRSRPGRPPAGTTSPRWVAEDIAAGKALANVPLPAWVRGRQGERRARRARAAGRVFGRARRLRRRGSTLPVYRRQLFPDPVLGERRPTAGTTIFETDAVRMWHLGDDVGIVSFKSKAQHDRRGRARRPAARDRRGRARSARAS